SSPATRRSPRSSPRPASAGWTRWTPPPRAPSSRRPRTRPTRPRRPTRRTAPAPKEPMTMSARKQNGNASKDLQLEELTTARVVDSLVLRGDISALTAEERTRYYVHLCETLGLNPQTQPFAILRLQGKEILYPTRGATDQLAAIHKINRE